MQGAGGRSEPDRASTSGLRLDARLLWIVFCGDAGFLRFAFALAKVMESDYRALFGIRSMKHLAALTLVALLGPAVHAGGSLKEARKLWLQGNYAEAQEMYADLGKDSAAVIGLSKAHQSQGQYDKAQQVVEKALKLFARPPADLLARHGELLYLQGQWNEAEKAAEAAIAASADSFLGHWVLAQVLRDKGEIKSADDEYRWFVRAYNDKEITDPDNLLLVGLASLERARLHHLHDQFQVVIDDLFNEALKKDKDYWPAAYEKGRIFLERHDKKDAYTAFEKALTINPQAAEVLAAKAEMAAMGLEMTDAAEFADEALKINPNLTAALRIMADVQSFSGENDKAVKNLEKARSINPRDEETLGRIAAGLVVQRKNAEFQAIVKEVEKYNQKPYDFYVVLASQLDGRKVYLDAEKYFKVAADLQPKLPQAQAGLGMMYMRMGREPEALKALEEAYAADKFDVRVINTLKVLDHLKKYQTIETEHFTLRYDPKNDEVLAKYMARYLEQLHKEYAGLFGHQPEGKILIEVFSKHEMFSGRVVAIPDLHTIGACTGRMFAMVSVHDTSKVIPKPFNWVRVLRHELVHIFNLDQTKFLCPHWFTEGLAVTHEGSATPLNWMQILAEKRAADDLLNLDNILLGFVRPRNQTQWHQAYAQSQLYTEYLTRTYGDKAVGKMLTAFGQGMDTAQALEKTLGVKKEAFEKGYREFLAERVKDVPVRAAVKPLTLKQLKEMQAKNPDDLEVLGRLAERYQQLGKQRDAGELADKLLAAKRDHPVGLYVKALILIGTKDVDLATSLLENNTGEDTKDTRPLKILGKLQFEAKKFAAAAVTYERCRKLEPFEPQWIGQLAKCYTKTGNREKMLEIFKEVVRTEPDELSPRRTLAKHYLDAKDMAAAERYARMGIEIDVLDRDCQAYLLEALDAQGKDDEARALRTIFGK